MTITNHVWQHIRTEFEEEERAQFRAAIVAETICPNAVTIDADKLPPALKTKLEEVLDALMREGKFE